MEIPGFYVKRPIEEICSRPCPLSPSFLLFSFFVFLFFFFISILFPLVITQVFSIEFRRMHETTTPYRYAIKPGFNSIPRRRGRRYFHHGGEEINPVIRVDNASNTFTDENRKVSHCVGHLGQHILCFYLGYTRIRNYLYCIIFMDL